jgi:uncharacterized protein (DUF2141 family)
VIEMIRRRAVGLSVPCALLVCALAASSAQALTGTTAVTCKSEASATQYSEGFSDEHCTKSAIGTEVKFVHEEIKPGTSTQLTVKGVEGNPKLKTTIFGAQTELEAGGFTSCANKATVENKENASKQMEAAGESCGEFSSVVVKKPAKCSVKGGAVKLLEKGSAKTVVKEPASTEYEMYVEFKPPIEVLAEITFEGAECALKGVTVKVTGTAKANVSTENGCVLVDGPTLKFTTSQTEKTLKVGASSAQFEGTFTPRMTSEEKKEENPVALTTTST